MAVKPIPDGYHTVTPYLIVSEAAKLLEYLKQAFGAEVNECMTGPGGEVQHAQITIGDSKIMMGEARDEWPAMPGSLYLYVPDTDAVYKRAMEAGGKSLMEPADQFYGDRNAGVVDPSGNYWWIATHVEDVPPEEMEKRAAAHHNK
jgi:uncharacterized glyoxalase superfamily protein PhnB